MLSNCRNKSVLICCRVWNTYGAIRSGGNIREVSQVALESTMRTYGEIIF